MTAQRYISCDGLKDENEGTNQQIIFDKFCSSSRGKWKGPLKRNEMDKNTDFYFL